MVFVHTKIVREPGTLDCLSTVEVEHKRTALPRTRGRADGYGNQIPIGLMVRWNGRWRRVYCVCWSNSGTLYIKSKNHGEFLVVQIAE